MKWYEIPGIADHYKAETRKIMGEEYPGDWCPIGDVNFTVRTEFALMAAGVKTLGSLRQLTLREFLTTKNISRRQLAEVNTRFDQWGLRPIGEDAEPAG